MKNFHHNKFSEIYDFVKDLTKKQKGDIFEEFTYYLFKLDPRLNNNLENIWFYKDIPNKILSELNLPSRDKGIDLLAKINNQYYAIQCKFRQDPNVTISWSELSTFFGLSFGLNNKIKGGFFVTNTYDLCEEVIKSTKIEPVYGDFFDNLPINFYKCIRDNNNKIEYIRKKPYQYQKSCKMNCEFHYIDYDRAYIEMACGTGKTLTAYWINKLFDGRIVVFVPSLYLLSQFYSDWVNQSCAENVHVKYLLIGSDVDVDEEVKYKSNGLILYTDPESIRNYIKNIKEKLVVICTYQSSDKLAEACDDIEFDFGIFDEAHKTVGQVNKKFTQMLTNEYMTIKNRLFMTATPKIYCGNLENEDVVSMDNKNFYGDKLFTYNTGNAIRNGKLVDYQVVSIYVKNADIEKTITENKFVKFKNEFVNLEANYLGIIIVLLKKIHDGTCKHLITYHNKIKSAKLFAEYLEKINNLLYDEMIFIDHINGSDSMCKRNKIIKDFKDSNKSVLCSARVLNEGVNIPIVDSVCFVDPRNSTIDIVQCVGRSLRLYPNKSMAHIIVPIFIENFNEDFDKNAYDNVIRILKALKSTDDGIVEHFKLNKQGRNNGRQILVNEYYDVENYSKDIDLDEWNDTIEEKVWHKIDPFDEIYNKIKIWVNDHNRLPSSVGKDNIEQCFGRWCERQRGLNRKGKLSNDKKIKLENMKLWYWSQDDNFNNFYEKIKIWINENNRIPSQMSKNDLEKRLGKFCSHKREDKKTGKISNKRIKQLESLPHWYWQKSDPFDENYNKVINWIQIHNKTPSSTSNDELERHLGRWSTTQRKKFRNHEMSDHQIKLLEKIPKWYWHKDDNFIKNYNEMKQWVKENNRIPSNKSKDDTEKRLGNFCSHKRYAKKNGKLTKNQIEQLEQINNWCWGTKNISKPKSFDEKYTELKKWVDENQRLPFLSGDQIEKQLAKWCYHKRENCVKNKLTKSQIKLLENLPHWYWNKKKSLIKSRSNYGSKTSKIKKYF